MRKAYVKPYGVDKIYMDKDLIEHPQKFTSTPAKFYLILFDKMHSFYDGNGRTRYYFLIMK